jgi:hypothetical protein
MQDEEMLYQAGLMYFQLRDSAIELNEKFSNAELGDVAACEEMLSFNMPTATGLGAVCKMIHLLKLVQELPPVEISPETAQGNAAPPPPGASSSLLQDEIAEMRTTMANLSLAKKELAALQKEHGEVLNRPVKETGQWKKPDFQAEVKKKQMEKIASQQQKVQQNLISNEVPDDQPPPVTVYHWLQPGVDFAMKEGIKPAPSRGQEVTPEQQTKLETFADLAIQAKQGLISKDIAAVEEMNMVTDQHLQRRENEKQQWQHRHQEMEYLQKQEKKMASAQKTVDHYKWKIKEIMDRNQDRFGGLGQSLPHWWGLEDMPDDMNADQIGQERGGPQFPGTQVPKGPQATVGGVDITVFKKQMEDVEARKAKAIHNCLALAACQMLQKDVRELAGTGQWNMTMENGETRTIETGKRGVRSDILTTTVQRCLSHTDIYGPKGSQRCQINKDNFSWKIR